jgi:hypothetical protein
MLKPIPAPEVRFTDDALHIRLPLHGAVGALRRTVTIPYRRVRDVRVGPVRTQDPTLWRMGGLAGPRSLFGTFRRGGHWLFLATPRRDAAVHLVLDGDGPERVSFAAVVVGSDDPDALAAEIRARLR